MAQYRVLQKSFINNTIVEEGTIVEYDGEPGDNLQAMKKKKGSAAPVDSGDEESQQEQAGE